MTAMVMRPVTLAVTVMVATGGRGGTPCCRGGQRPQVQQPVPLPCREVQCRPHARTIISDHLLLGDRPRRRTSSDERPAPGTPRGVNRKLVEQAPTTQTTTAMATMVTVMGLQALMNEMAAKQKMEDDERRDM